VRVEGQRQQLQVVGTVLLVAFLLAGCSAGGEGGQVEDPAGGVQGGPPPATAPAGQPVSAALPSPAMSLTGPSDTLELRLAAPDAVAAGEPVELRLTVRNAAGRPLDLYLRGRQIAFDVSAEDAGGNIVWSRLHDEIIPAILRLETLPAGDSIVLSHRWDQRTNAGTPAATGTYRLRGTLLTEGEPLHTPILEMRIVARP
jgi:hypothetical protein